MTTMETMDTVQGQDSKVEEVNPMAWVLADSPEAAPIVPGLACVLDSGHEPGVVLGVYPNGVLSVAYFDPSGGGNAAIVPLSAGDILVPPKTLTAKIEAATAVKIVNGVAEINLVGGGFARIGPGTRVMAQRDGDSIEEGVVVSVAPHGAFIRWDTTAERERDVTGTPWEAVYILAIA